MIRAYDEMYLRNARSLLADSIDYATYTEGYDPSEYYNMFIKCDIARKYEKEIHSRYRVCPEPSWRCV